MRKLSIPFILATLLLIVIFGVIQKAHGQDGTVPDGLEVVSSETQGDNTRQIYAPAGTNAVEQPQIGFIDSPTAICFQPDPKQDNCYINWYYMSVNASPNYMVNMTVTLNTIGTVARIAGFFQTSMYVPYNMLGQGFKVACGAQGAGGIPTLGNSYPWTIQAIDSAKLKSANYGTVYCPYKKP